MITACRLFGYSSVLTFLLTLVFMFTLLVLGDKDAASGMAIIGLIASCIQGAFWACNK